MGGLHTPPNSNPRTPPVSNEPVDDIAMSRRAARTYRTGPQPIMPYLYLGGAGNVEPEQLGVLDITHVLNVAREVNNTPTLSPYMVYRHCMWDHNEPELARYFADCFAFIDEARNRHHGVLVHCQLGVSRSASLVIAYVMRTMGLRFAAAYEYVRVRAPCISPNLSLIGQLCEYGEGLAGGQRGSLVDGLPDLSLSADDEESSAAGSENSSPLDVVVNEGAVVGVDLLTMPIKQVAVPLLMLPPSTPSRRSFVP
ncbi:tyrosine/serine/threonine protein phosphatase [Coemansia sp. BCRC 34301]|nr:tyrosine/serine/threonine protein phosphatase [Coemansia sp. BCRC 34301]